MPLYKSTNFAYGTEEVSLNVPLGRVRVRVRVRGRGRGR